MQPTNSRSVVVITIMCEIKIFYLPALPFSFDAFGSCESFSNSFSLVVFCEETFVLNDSFFLAETFVSRLLRVWALVANVAKDEINEKKKEIKQNKADDLLLFRANASITVD